MRIDQNQGNEAMKSGIAKRGVRLMVGGLLGAVAASAIAQAPAQGLLDNAWVFNAGAFIVGSDIKATLNGNTVTANQEINFNDTFGTGSSATRVRLDALWRITPAHHLRLMYFNNDNTHTRTIDKDITWGDNTYHAGATVTAETKYQIVDLNYEYAFMRSPTYEIAGIAGLYWSKTTLALSGNASTGGGASVSFQSQSNEVNAPLPVLGLRGGWVVAPQWYLEAQGLLFGYNGNGFDGNWSDVRLNATWMFHKNWGLGLGYDRYATRVDVSKSGFNGKLKTGYDGLQLYLTGTF
jgi:hypothetical protein